MTCPTGRNASAGPRLVIIDEAGMADTLSLDTAVQFIIGRGGSVRLIGDDQQLAAIGAGGVLRDIASQPRRGPADRAAPVHRPRRSRRHPRPPRRPTRSARLLPRPATRPRRRPHHHPDDVFNAWQADRSHGLDAIMLAPTRELVAQLNQRARDHRLAGTSSRAGGRAWPTATRPASAT